MNIPAILKTVNQLPKAFDTINALANMKVVVGGKSGSKISIDKKRSTLNISTPDLLAALPSGAGLKVTVSPNPPSGGSNGDIWINYGGNAITSMITHPMFFTGSLILNSIFGYFGPSTSYNLVGAMIFAQTAPTGADAIFTLVDGSGTSLGVTLTLPAGTNYVSLVPTLVVSAGGIVRAKITQIGSTVPGGYVTLALQFSQ